LRLLGVTNYARLSVVDDPSIPLVYALLAIALVAVSASILGRQSLATVVVSRHDDGTRTVDVWFRDWRANKVRTEQAQEALREALTPVSNVDGDTE
jgi:cytochrome c biogenesis protein ResB